MNFCCLLYSTQQMLTPNSTGGLLPRRDQSTAPYCAKKTCTKPLRSTKIIFSVRIVGNVMVAMLIVRKMMKLKWNGHMNQKNLKRVTWNPRSKRKVVTGPDTRQPNSPCNKMPEERIFIEQRLNTSRISYWISNSCPLRPEMRWSNLSVLSKSCCLAHLSTYF